MKTKAWTGSAEAGFVEDVLTLSSKIKIVSGDKSDTLPLLYAIYIMLKQAQKKQSFVAYDEDGKEIAMYKVEEEKIIAKAEIHEAISGMFLLLDSEQGEVRHRLVEEIKEKYGISLDK